MPGPLDLTDQDISDTYGRVVQISANKLYDGLGNLILDLSTIGSGGGFYVHNQAVASATWTITHNLGKEVPDIVVLDSAGTLIIGPSLTLIDNNTIELNWSFAFGGTAYVS